MMPTAAMPPSGTIGVGVSVAPPYNTLYLSGQPTDWLHAGARYVAITNRPYDDAIDQSFKDKSFDVALRLLEESDGWPAVVVGLNDFGGTGLFSSEYIVATRRWYDWSVTLGLGFGRFGTQGDVRNPLAVLGLRSDERELLAPAEAQGGAPAVDDWFAGRDASIIAGIEWAPRYLPWSFQIELDGNDYSAEPAERRLAADGRLETFDERIDPRSRINVGLRYKPRDSSWFAGLAFVRGETLIGHIGVAPRLGSDRSRVREYGLPASTHLHHPDYRRSLEKLDTPDGVSQWLDELAARRVYAHAAHVDPQTRTLSVWQSNNVSDQSIDVLRTTARTALARLPDGIERVEVVEVAGGMDALSLSAQRDVLDAEARGLASVDELRARVELRSRATLARDQAAYRDLLEYPVWVYGASPAIRANIGGLDGFVLAQLQLKPFVTLQLTPGWSFTGVGAIGIAGNLDKARQRESSSLPNVRSRLEQYQTTGDDAYIDQLETDYLFPLGPSLYGRLSAGIFEEMYGGVAAEVLYRPLYSRLAYGVNVNYVRQRDFDQRFDFLDYKVATGHFTVYYDTPFDGFVLKTSFGRYLARDVGVTLDIAREFRNGVILGAFATKTDVSAEEFGEGSFDKGIYLRLPLSLFYPGADKGAVSFDYRFLTRDGGQKVRDGRPLYDVVGRFHAGQVYEN